MTKLLYGFVQALPKGTPIMVSFLCDRTGALDRGSDIQADVCEA